MNYKYGIGQYVKVSMYNPSIGEYDTPGVITLQSRVYTNGTPTYEVELSNGNTLSQVSEERIKLSK